VSVSKGQQNDNKWLVGYEYLRISSDITA